MPISATILRIFVACTSEVDEERKAVYQIIANWNAIHSMNTQLFLEAVSWKSHAQSEMGERAQAKINHLLGKCDMLIGIFWTRFGTPTGDFDSGTQEEIETFMTSGKPVMIYFSNALIPPDKIKSAQYKKVMSFKKRCEANGLIDSYSSDKDFRDHVSRDLEMHIEKDFNYLIKKNTTGILRTYTVWSGNIINDFISNEKELYIFLKDGHTFFIEKFDLLMQRFLHQELVTKVMVLHPNYEYMGAVADMDPNKRGLPDKQKKDCLDAISAMQKIRKKIKHVKHEDISRRITFLGYKAVPTWNGFIGHSKAYIHLYPTIPYRGKLQTLEIISKDLNGEETDWYNNYKNEFTEIERELTNNPEFNLWKFNEIK